MTMILTETEIGDVAEAAIVTTIMIMAMIARIQSLNQDSMQGHFPIGKLVAVKRIITNYQGHSYDVDALFISLSTLHEIS